MSFSNSVIEQLYTNVKYRIRIVKMKIFKKLKGLKKAKCGNKENKIGIGMS